MTAFTAQPITELRDAMTFGDYCDFPALNQSKLKRFDYALGGCPALYRHDCTHLDERRESAALATGRRYHHFLLEPASFGRHYALLTEEIQAQLLDEALATKSTAKGFSKLLKSYKDWEAAQNAEGREVVTLAEADQLDAMRQAIVSDPVIMDALGMGSARTEVSAFCGYDLGNGVRLQLKARFDLVPGNDTLVDLKTCRSADARDFANQVYRLGYDRQAAFYLDVARWNKLDVKRFGFLAQDKFPPYLPCIHWLPSDWLAAARVWYRAALYRIADCIKTDRWPGRKSGELEPPAWAQGEIEALG